MSLTLSLRPLASTLREAASIAAFSISTPVMLFAFDFHARRSAIAPVAVPRSITVSFSVRD